MVSARSCEIYFILQVLMYIPLSGDVIAFSTDQGCITRRTSGITIFFFLVRGLYLYLFIFRIHALKIYTKENDKR